MTSTSLIAGITPKSRVRVTIEGPRGSGKSAIRRVITDALKEWGVTYKSYDPVHSFRPEQIDFEDAEVIIMVKTKTPKPKAEEVAA